MNKGNENRIFGLAALGLSRRIEAAAKAGPATPNMSSSSRTLSLIPNHHKTQDVANAMARKIQMSRGFDSCVTGFVTCGISG
jgi:hypothetical protein